MSMSFSETYYLNNNPDVLQAVLSGAFPSGLAHYNQHGWSEGRDPNANFDTSYYLQQNPDVLTAVVSGAFASPLEHFLAHGAAEGRAPNAEAAPLVAAFDADAYLAANLDVEAAIEAGAFENAMEHWLLFGQFEDRPGVPFVGQEFTLTTATDDFTGGEGNDTFNAPLDLAIDGLVGAQTLQGTDVLNGGGGRDELNAELNGTGATANPRISNIEVYNLTAISSIAFGLGGFGELDLARASGYEELWNRDSRVDLYLYNVGEVAAIGMDNVRGGTEYYVEYDNDVEVDTQNVIVQNTGSAGTGSAWLNIETDGSIDAMNLNVSNSYLDVSASVSDTMNLMVMGGVVLWLGDGADGAEDLNIVGSGPLSIDGEDDFEGLINLDSTGYDGDLDIDARGSTTLETVMTGPGDDRVVVNYLSVDGEIEEGVPGGFTADMGEGNNTLAIAKTDGFFPDNLLASNISDLDFTGGVQNVQTLEFAQDILFGVNPGTLDLEGFDDQLSLIQMTDFEANGNNFTILNAPEDLAIVVTGDDFDMDGGLFTIEGTVNLSISAIDEIDLMGGVNSETLETLSLESLNDADVYLESGLDLLTDLSVVTGDDADVEIDVSGAPGELGALENISISSGSDATLRLTGAAGTVPVAGVQQVETITVDVTGPGNSIGTVLFNSTDLDSGVAPTSFSVTGLETLARDQYAALDIATALNTQSGLSATVPTLLGVPTSNVITVTWDDFGPKQGLDVAAQATTSGGINSIAPSIATPGVTPVAMVPGEGLESLETVSVEAAEDATVELIDIYGELILTVDAGDAADVTLTNTEVVSATVNAGTDLGDMATVVTDGNTVGARSLEELTVSGDMADITMTDDHSSFTVLDVSGVITNLVVDTSGAEFTVGAGQYITYLIGATSDDVDGTPDVDFTGNDVREVYEFVGGDIGEVEITAFTAGADPATGDRLDLSHLGVNNSGELIFTNDGGDLVITSLGEEDFTGSITLVGLGADAADVSAFNIIYA